jgi:hypothetical protein
MITVLWLKRYEIRTGRVFFVQVRPSAGAFFRGALGWVEHVLPALVAREIRRGYVWARIKLRAGVAWIIIVAEGLLERGLHLLRHKTNVPYGEASPFLREVAEHKRKLLEEREEN